MIDDPNIGGGFDDPTRNTGISRGLMDAASARFQNLTPRDQPDVIVTGTQHDISYGRDRPEESGTTVSGLRGGGRSRGRGRSRSRSPSDSGSEEEDAYGPFNTNAKEVERSHFDAAVRNSQVTAWQHDQARASAREALEKKESENMTSALRASEADAQARSEKQQAQRDEYDRELEEAIRLSQAAARDSEAELERQLQEAMRITAAEHETRQADEQAQMDQALRESSEVFEASHQAREQADMERALAESRSSAPAPMSDEEYQRQIDIAMQQSRVAFHTRYGGLGAFGAGLGGGESSRSIQSGGSIGLIRVNRPSVTAQPAPSLYAAGGSCVSLGGAPPSYDTGVEGRSARPAGGSHDSRDRSTSSGRSNAGTLGPGGARE